MRQPMDCRHPADFPRSSPRRLPGQIVLVLQGGRALGSYQAGVYQALQEAGIEPDWIIGASIGRDSSRGQRAARARGRMRRHRERSYALSATLN